MTEKSELQKLKVELHQTLEEKKQDLLRKAAAYPVNGDSLQVDGWRKEMDRIRLDVERLAFAYQNAPSAATSSKTTVAGTYGV